MTKNIAKTSPGPNGISYEDVATAAEALIASGARASFRKVREALGGTGSLTTIQKHLKQWKEGYQPVVVADVDLSPVLHRAIVTEMAQVAASARSEVAMELAEVEDARNLLTEELEKRLPEIEHLTGQVWELENSVAALGGVIEELRAGAAAGAERERVLTGKAETLARELARAEVLLEQVPAMRQAVADTQAQLEAEREQRHSAVREAAVLAAKLVAAEGLAETLANQKQPSK